MPDCTDLDLGQGDWWGWEGGPCVEERLDPEPVVGHAMGYAMGW